MTHLTLSERSYHGATSSSPETNEEETHSRHGETYLEVDIDPVEGDVDGCRSRSRGEVSKKAVRRADTAPRNS